MSKQEKLAAFLEAYEYFIDNGTESGAAMRAFHEYRFAPDDHAWAFEKRERLIEDLKRRTETGDWSDPEEGGICEFKRPGWCK